MSTLQGNQREKTGSTEWVKPFSDEWHPHPNQTYTNAHTHGCTHTFLSNQNYCRAPQVFLSKYRVNTALHKQTLTLTLTINPGHWLDRSEREQTCGSSSLSLGLSCTSALCIRSNSHDAARIITAPAKQHRQVYDTGRWLCHPHAHWADVSHEGFKHLPNTSSTLHVPFIALPKHARAHTSTHTHMHAHMYTHTHAHAYIHIRTHMHTYTYAHTCIHTHTHAHAYIHIRTHIYKRWS